MTTGKRKFWLKLTDGFFTSETLDFLMSQEGGANYVVLYLMLRMLTASTGGKLIRAVGDMLIPYDTVKIQRDCKYFSADTVRVAESLYRNLGLLYEDANGVLTLAGEHICVQSETDYARQKRMQRKKKADALLSPAAHPAEKQLPAPDTARDVDTEVDTEVDIGVDTEVDIGVDIGVDNVQTMSTHEAPPDAQNETPLYINYNKSMKENPYTDTSPEKESKEKSSPKGEEKEKERKESPGFGQETKLTLDFSELKIRDSELPEELKDALVRWAQYKAQMFNFLYTELGLHALIKTTLKNARRHGTQAVLKTIQLSMDKEWRGIIWDKVKEMAAPEPFPAEHKAYKAAVFLDEKRRKRMPSLSPAEEPILQKWAVCFNECHEVDKHEWEEISRVLAFSQKNEFWSAKITDAYSFRRKYVNLLSEMPKSTLPRPEAPLRRTCSISELVEYPEGSGNWMPPWEAEERRKREE